MNTRWMVALWLGVAAQPVLGQIAVNGRLQSDRVLLFEPVAFTVRIGNQTGRPLHFGGPGADASLAFDVEQTPGIPLPLSGTPLLEGPLVLPAGETRELTVDLLKSYPLRTTGPYSVRARVEWSDRAFLSPKEFLDVLPGLEVGRLLVGVPGSGAMRAFSLRTLTRQRMELLFLRMDDDQTGACLGLSELGRVVRQFKPAMDSDAKGHVHILFQSSPWQFTHAEVNPDGIPVGVKDFAAHSSEVRLEKSADGAVTVRGIRAAADHSLFVPPPTEPPSGRKKKR